MGQGLKGVPLGDIVHHDDPMMSSTVRRREAPKGFTTSGIPHLKLEEGISGVYDRHFGCKVDANGVDMGFGKGPVHVSCHYR